MRFRNTCKKSVTNSHIAVKAREMIAEDRLEWKTSLNKGFKQLEEENAPKNTTHCSYTGPSLLADSAADLTQQTSEGTGMREDTGRRLQVPN